MRLVPALLAGLVVLSACATAPAPAPADCVPGSGGRSTVEHAENFSLRYEDGYQVLTVNEPSPGAAPETYVLVSCGATPDLPPDLASAPRIPVPITSLFSASTTHLPLLVDLGRLDVLTGVATASYVSSPEVRALLEAGAVTEFAPTEQVDVERVVAASPDVLMSGGFDDPAFPALRACRSSPTRSTWSRPRSAAPSGSR